MTVSIAIFSCILSAKLWWNQRKLLVCVRVCVCVCVRSPASFGSLFWFWEVLGQCLNLYLKVSLIFSSFFRFVMWVGMCRREKRMYTGGEGASMYGQKKWNGVWLRRGKWSLWIGSLLLDHWESGVSVCKWSVSPSEKDEAEQKKSWRKINGRRGTAWQI